MATPLAEYRLVYVAPAAGRTAVGDYAENFVAAVRPLVGEVVEYRTNGPGEDTAAEVARGRRAVAELVAQGPPGRVFAHAELAAGLMTPFWATAGLAGIPTTATVHDPPQGLWFPGRTQFVARHKLLMHGLHYPLRPLSTALERRVNGRRTLFALTDTGRRSISQRFPHSDAVYIPHLVSDRPAIVPARQRPRAVGFFGHVYRGKGFELVADIRRRLPGDVAVRVAGRGTESLPPSDGIEIVGEVNGAAEDAFFSSVRAIVVPYGKRHFYDETYPASGVVAHAMAYRTPVVATAYGSLAELGEADGAVVVRPPDAATSPAVALASAITALFGDDDRLAALGEASERTRRARSATRTAEAFAATWADRLARQHLG